MHATRGEPLIGRRAAAAGIATRLGNHSFRATRISIAHRSTLSAGQGL
jgi:hypothetical protein